MSLHFTVTIGSETFQIVLAESRAGGLALVGFKRNITLNAATPARAASTCSSVLTDSQLRDFETMVFPSNPYAPNLGEADDGDGAQGTVKRLTSREIEKLNVLPRPRLVAVRDLRSEQDVAPLKDWLKSNPPADLPAWESAVVGMMVPDAWLELTADDFLHLLDRPGNAGPVKTTTLSTTTSQSRAIGVTQHVGTDATGKLKFLWKFTDFCIKRDPTWQVVASHQSRVLKEARFPHLFTSRPTRVAERRP